MKKRIISILTALALCLGMCPGWFLAAEEAPSLCPAPSSGGDYETGADAAPLPEAGVPTLTAEGGETGGDVAEVTIDGTTTGYSDIQSAWKAVQGQTATLKLLKDTQVSSSTDMQLTSGNLTLEMAENVKLYGIVDDLLRIDQGASLTITNGIFENTYSTGNAVLVGNYGNSTYPGVLTILGGTITSKGMGISAWRSSKVVISGGKIDSGKGGVLVNSGTLNISGGEITSGATALTISSSCEAKISGGKFTGSTQSVTNDTYNGSVSKMLEDGFAFKQGGTWVTDTSVRSLTGIITVESAPVKLEMDSVTTFYATADEAWAAAKGKTAKITLLADVQAAAPLKVTANDNITFDGGKYMLTGPSSGDLITVDGGTLSITNGTLKGTLNVTGGEVNLTLGTYSSIKAGGDKTYKDLLGEGCCYFKGGNPVDIIYETQTELTDVKVDACDHRDPRGEHIEGTTRHTRLTCAWCGLEGGTEACTFESVDSATREGTCTLCGNQAAAVASVTDPYSFNTTYYAAIDDAWAAVNGICATITLLSDAEASAPLTLGSGSDITFNGGSCTLTSQSSDLIIVWGGKLSITGGTFSSIKTNSQEQTCADLLANGCCYYKDNAPVKKENVTQELKNVTVGVCEHQGADFTPISNSSKHKVSCPCCTPKGDEDCTLTPEGVCTRCKQAGTAVAQVTIGESTATYANVDAAWNAAKGRTAAIKLLSDVTTASSLMVEPGDNITFDGGEFALEYVEVIVTGGTVRLTGGTFGSIDCSAAGKTVYSLLGSGYAYFDEYENMIEDLQQTCLKDITVACAHEWDQKGVCTKCKKQAEASVTIDGRIRYYMQFNNAIYSVDKTEPAGLVNISILTDLECPEDERSCLTLWAPSGSQLTLDGGGKTLSGYMVEIGGGWYNLDEEPSGGTVNLTCCKIDNKDAEAAVMIRGGKVRISNCEFTAGHIGLFVMGGDVKITSGTFTGEYAIRIGSQSEALTLADLLAEDCLYFPDGAPDTKPITEGLDGKSLPVGFDPETSGPATDYTCTVKPCGHPGVTYTNPSPLTHQFTCTTCGHNKDGNAPAVNCTYSAANNWTCTCGSRLEVTLSGAEGLVYDGSEKKPAVSVTVIDKAGTPTTVDGSHYTVTYANNISAGTAAVTVVSKDVSGSAPAWTVEKTFTIEKADPRLTLTPSPAALSNGGSVTLTLTGLPAGGTAVVTCSGGITVTAGAGGDWTADLPGGNAVYTFKADYAGDGNYNAASARCTVEVKESAIDPPSASGLSACWRNSSGVLKGELVIEGTSGDKWYMAEVKKIDTSVFVTLRGEPEQLIIPCEYGVTLNLYEMNGTSTEDFNQGYQFVQEGTANGQPLTILPGKTADGTGSGSTPDSGAASTPSNAGNGGLSAEWKPSNGVLKGELLLNGTSADKWYMIEVKNVDPVTHVPTSVFITLRGTGTEPLAVQCANGVTLNMFEMDGTSMADFERSYQFVQEQTANEELALKGAV